MADTKKRLKRMQLADALRTYPLPEAAAVPRGGWARAARGAGYDPGPVGWERRITLESLDRLARAMGCRMVHALMPEGGSLDGLRERQRQLLADALLNGSPRKLWQ